MCFQYRAYEICIGNEPLANESSARVNYLMHLATGIEIMLQWDRPLRSVDDIYILLLCSSEK